jgi:hypothetical protein
MLMNNDTKLRLSAAVVKYQSGGGWTKKGK